MPALKAEVLADYLSKLYGRKVKVIRAGRAGQLGAAAKSIKGFGYGTPIAVEYSVGPRLQTAVIDTVRPGGFGHDFPWDRAHHILFAYSSFNKLPRHARALDVGYFDKRGRMRSVADYSEFFLLREMAKGAEYYRDLERIRDSGSLTGMDKARCLALSRYLARVHAKKKNAPELYVRRVRELVGHSECIMGLIDSYPAQMEYASQEELMGIEQACVGWRWRLKAKAHRLSRIHGDFHPFNVLFNGRTSFKVLDRSRGEWGEPADDVAAMAINYVFFSLQRWDFVSEPFQELYKLFIGSYLSETGDEEVLEVLPPFFVWRALVVASPIWYPNLPTRTRRLLFNFIRNMLSCEKVDYEDVNSYLKD